MITRESQRASEDTYGAPDFREDILRPDLVFVFDIQVSYQHLAITPAGNRTAAIQFKGPE